MSLLSQAIHLASCAHLEQEDKSGAPYILHPLAVMHMVKSLGFGDVEQAAAVCHDVMEDHPQWTSEIKKIAIENAEARFYWLCQQLTRGPRETYKEFIDRIVATRDPALISIKMCDIRHNSDITRLKGLTDKDFSRMKKYHRSYSELKTALEEIRGNVHQTSENA